MIRPEAEPPPGALSTDSPTLPLRREQPGGGGGGGGNGGSGRERLGPFELVRELGAGGMGQVHEAIDTRNGQRVALKLLFEIDPAGVYRLKREFRRMADITHENLISLYELHNEGSWWFFTMELLTGGSLADAMQKALVGGLKALRPLARQLVRGVHALHQAGRIHRDLKPSNVMVTSEGRVVILDYGLVNEIDHRTLFASSRGLIRGTPVFMAPEQAAGQLASPAADWYAVGVILFGVLAGRYPFEGGVMEMLLNKQQQDAPRVSTFNRQVPRELDDLVAALLSRVPAERPGVTELLAWCADGRVHTSLGVATAPAGAGELLEREAAMTTLHAGLRRALGGGPTCVDVVGAPGVGKTALIRRFEAGLAGAGVVWLPGTCSQRESVPYRAFDGLLDAVAAHLLELPEADCEAIIHDLGGSLYALAQIFPVLARVEWIARQIPRTTPQPEEMRRWAFFGLKMVLFRIAERRPTVIALDNLHWGDLDSARLLDFLLAPPDVPSCLFILGYRPDAQSPLLREFSLQRAMTTPGYTRLDVEVAPLSPDAAAALAQRLLAGPVNVRTTRLAQRIAAEAEGNPALVQALVEEALRPGGDPEQTIGGRGRTLLRRLVQARLARLPAESREVFARVAASAGSLLLTELLRAGAWEGDILALLAQLRGQGLVRLDGEGEAQRIAVVSESIQEAAQAALEPALWRRSHEELATMLLVGGADDPERIGRHLHAAGLVEQAYEHVTSAAYVATKALAFDRAAELYRFALECKQGQWSLQKNCAEALVQAGRGAEAAELFLAASEGAPAAAAPRLRREAAEQFLVHGELGRGMAVLRPLLQAAQIELPNPGRELNAQIALHTERLGRRGLSLTERSEFELARRDLDRIDLCWTAGKGLMLNDPVQAELLLLQCTHMALEAGEPRRAARSLALGGLSLSSRNYAEGERMIGEAQRLGERIRDHYSIGLATVCRGILSRISGQWMAALNDLDFGVQYLQEHCPGSMWERGLGQASTMAALEALGEFRTMSQRTEELLRRAQEAGDVHTSLIAALYSALTLIAGGQTAQARARVREAFSRWPRQGFHVQHLHALKVGIYCDLYERRPGDAWQRIVSTWPLLERSDFMRVSTRRAEALTLRAKASLAALRAAPGDFGHLSVVIDQDIAQLERDGGGQTAQLSARRHLLAEAALLRAGLASCKGDHDEAGRLLSVALSGFETAGMSLSALVLRRVRGRRGGPSTTRAVAEADALLGMQNVRDGDAWTRVVCPGLVD